MREEKMKTCFRKPGALALALLLVGCLVFSGCSDSDDDDGGGTTVTGSYTVAGAGSTPKIATVTAGDISATATWTAGNTINISVGDQTDTATRKSGSGTDSNPFIGTWDLDTIEAWITFNADFTCTVGGPALEEGAEE
jgi:hypothetical protein